MAQCIITRRGGGGLDTSDATATSAHIVKGYTAYAKDQLLTGTLNLYNANTVMDFPVSIQLEEPTAIREGHIWIKSDKAAQIKSVYISEAPTDTATSGSITIVVGSMLRHKIVSEDTKQATNGTSVSFLSAHDSLPSSSSWLVGYTEGVHEYRINTPYRAYSKLGTTLTVENAYRWTGSMWSQFSSNTERIIISTPYTGYATDMRSRIQIREISEDVVSTDYTELATVSSADYTASSTGVMSTPLVSEDGVYMFTGMVIDTEAPTGTTTMPYTVKKLVGSMYVDYYTLPKYYTIDGNPWKVMHSPIITKDGTLLIPVMIKSTTSSDRKVLVYKDNGTTYVLDRQSATIAYGAAATNQQMYITANSNATFIMVCCHTPDTSTYLMGYAFNKLDKWTKLENPPRLLTTLPMSVYNNDETKVWVNNYSSGYVSKVGLYTINYTTEVATLGSSSLNNTPGVYVMSAYKPLDLAFFVVGGAIGFYNTSLKSTTATISGHTMSGTNVSFSLNSTGTRALITDGLALLYCSAVITATSAAFTVLQKITTGMPYDRISCKLFPGG